MGNRSAVFDRLDIQAGRLQCRDRAFATAAWAFDANVDFLHPELDGLFRSLLSCHLARKRSAFATSLKVASSGTGPTQRLTFCVGDGDGCIVERRVNVGYAMGNIATNSFFLRFSQFLKTPNVWFACRSSGDP